MTKNYDLDDNEIRVLGSSPSQAPRQRKGLLAALMALAVLALIVFLVIFLGDGTPDSSEPVVGAENTQTQPTPASGCSIYDTVVNESSFRIIYPSGEPTLHVGALSATTDTNIICAVEAAYYRKDNGMISGAFICKGEQLSRGYSMLGYCAIIDGNIHLGNAKSTSLFEEAVENDGYFFRQKPLVDSSTAIHEKNSRRNPAYKIRRVALAKLKGQDVVIMCDTPIRMNDFADNLVALGCQQAIALTGNDCFGFARNADGNLLYWGVALDPAPASINYIIWSK